MIFFGLCRVLRMKEVLEVVVLLLEIDFEDFIKLLNKQFRPYLKQRNSSLFSDLFLYYFLLQWIKLVFEVHNSYYTVFDV